MTHESTFQVLAECEHGYIGVCECCHEFNFAYKTVLLTFQEDEMRQFFDWLIGCRHAPHHYQPMRHGRNRVFSSPHSNLFLTYSDEELDEIASLYKQTVVMLQVQNILLQKRPD